MRVIRLLLLPFWLVLLPSARAVNLLPSRIVADLASLAQIDPSTLISPTGTNYGELAIFVSANGATYAATNLGVGWGSGVTNGTTCIMSPSASRSPAAYLAWLQVTLPTASVMAKEGATMDGTLVFAVSQPTATTSAANIVRLTDSVTSPDQTTAATPNSVKTAYDVAAAAVPKSSGAATNLTSIQANTNNPAFWVNNSGSKTFGLGNGWWGTATLNVAYLIPSVAGDLALDLIPNGSGAHNTWIDMCNVDGRTNGFGANSGQWFKHWISQYGWGGLTMDRNASVGTNHPLYIQYKTGAGRVGIGQGFGDSDYPLLYMQVRPIGITGADTNINFGIEGRDGGIWLAAFPKSGTTRLPLRLDSSTLLWDFDGNGTLRVPGAQLRPATGINWSVDSDRSRARIGAFDDSAANIGLTYQAASHMVVGGTGWTNRSFAQFRPGTDLNLGIDSHTLVGTGTDALSEEAYDDSGNDVPRIMRSLSHQITTDGGASYGFVATNNTVRMRGAANANWQVSGSSAKVILSALNDALTAPVSLSIVSTNFFWSFDGGGTRVLPFQIRPATDMNVTLDLNGSAARFAAFKDNLAGMPLQYQGTSHAFTSDGGTTYGAVLTNNVFTVASLVSSGNATVSGNASVTGTLAVTSTSTFTGAAQASATLAVGGSLVANTGFSVTSTTAAAMPAPSMSNTQKKALTQAGGSIIYNNTLGTHQVSDGAHWYDLASRRSIKAVSTTYALLADGTDDYSTIFCDSTGGAFDVTLPAATSYAGRVITVKDSGGAAGSNNITIKSAGGNIDNVAAATGVPLSTNYSAMVFQSDASKWNLIGKY